MGTFQWFYALHHIEFNRFWQCSSMITLLDLQTDALTVLVGSNQLEDILWTDKYQPKKSSEVIYLDQLYYIELVYFLLLSC